MRYSLDDLTIDINSQKVWQDQQLLSINGLNFRFLAFLLSKGTAIISFDELIEGVWAPAIVNEDTITQRVRLLRAALGDDGRNPRYIRSVRAQGYQLVTSPVVLQDAEASQPWWVKHRQHAVLLAASAVVISMVIAFGLSQPKPPEPVTVSNTKNPSSKLLERAQYYASIGQHDNNDRAIVLFEQVLIKEPDNIDAMLGLSRSYTRDMCRFNASKQQAERAEAIARTVINREPDNFHAYRYLGYSQDCRGQVQAAEAAYRQAIQLDPDGDLNSQSALAYLLGEKGQLAEALALNWYVSERDPGQTYNLIQVARVYELLGLLPIAERLYQESFELYPDNIHSNYAYARNFFYQERFAKARSAVQTSKQRPVHPDLYVLSAELALLDGDLNLARAELAFASQLRPSSAYYELLATVHGSQQVDDVWILNELEQIRATTDPEDPKRFILQAMLHQAIGNLDSGINALFDAVEVGYRNSDYLLLSPFFHGLRAAPSFQEVIERIDSAVKLELDTIYADGLVEKMLVTQIQTPGLQQ